MAEKRLLLLFDGHALIHRAYHAFANNPLTMSKTGEEVSAVYGFAQMLLKVLNEFRPSHWAIAFDLPTPTFRHKSFEEYKAHRPPPPESLRHQVQKVRQLVSAFHIPVFEVEGYEADDVIGTLSRQSRELGLETIIVTGDADTMQLVGSLVRVLYPKPGRPFSDTELFDEVKVRQKFGVAPYQLPDLKGLKGDPSDNIPGVPGVGEKTALRLLNRFGTLENIYEHLEEVDPPSLRELLLKHRDLAFKSKALATIATDIPVKLDPEACAISEFNREEVVRLFQEWEFVSLLPRLPGGRVSAVPYLEGAYRVIDEEQGLEELVSELAEAKCLSVDLETTGLDERTAELVGISLCWRPGEACYIPVGHRTFERQLPRERVLGRLAPFLSSPALPKIAHNGKYDMHVLSRHGIKLFPLEFDTMLAAHLLGEKALSLKSLAFTKLGIEMSHIDSLIGKGTKQVSMDRVSISRVAPYAAADAEVALRLKEVLEEEIKRAGLEHTFYRVEMPLVPILLEMEENGIALDLELLKELSRILQSELGRIEGEIYRLVGHRFNINSPQQLRTVLYDELKLPSSRKGKTGYSTEAAVLEELRQHHPVVGFILEYRQLAKLKSTYVDALPELVDPATGRVHTTFNQAGTATGRISSSDPNLQNIPVRGEWGKLIRKVFVAPPGSWLLSGDYSQIELRVLAHLSEDPELMAAFLRDEDIHSSTAARLFSVPIEQVTPEMRRVAKVVNFGVIYGISEYGLGQAAEISREEASRFIAAYFEKYKGVKAYIEATKQKAREHGYVETLLGRRRYIQEINSENRQAREAAERMAINMPVQGTAAEVLKLAMIDLHRELKSRGLRSKMLLQVHDELLFEVPEEEVEEMKALVPRIMSRAIKLKVPLKADIKIARNWGEMKD